VGRKTREVGRLAGQMGRKTWDGSVAWRGRWVARRGTGRSPGGADGSLGAGRVGR
jgi:hypothetical protein